MPALTCHTTYRTAAPAVVRALRRLAARQLVRDCGCLALAAAACWAALRLLWVIKNAVFLLAS